MLVPINTYVTFRASFGTTRTGKTVQYRILNYDGSELVAYTATGVVELGNGEYGVRTTFASPMVGFIQWKNVTDDIVIADPITVVADFLSTIATINTNTDSLESGQASLASGQTTISGKIDAVKEDTEDLLIAVANAQTKIDVLHKIETGRWKILNNQLIIYDEDETTPILTFNLKDSDGNPTSESPAEREPA